MPLITRDEQAPSVEKKVPIRATKPSYKGVTVDSTYIPRHALMTALEGSKWVVRYYQQVLDDDNVLSGQNTDRQAIFQQYICINELELRVEQALTQMQDDESKAMQITGSAVLHPSVIPNVGDMFLADVGDGREGVFRITTSQRRTIFKDTAHSVDYILIDYNTPERRVDFERKTIKTYHYVNDFHYHGHDPLVLEDDYKIIKDLRKSLSLMTRGYFQTFFSNEYQTLMVPGQTTRIYDHFLVRLIKRAFNTDEALCLQHLRALNVGDDKTMEALSLWDALIDRSLESFEVIFTQYGLVSTRTFTKNPMMESITYSGFQSVIYPADNEVCVDYIHELRQKQLLPDSLVEPDPSWTMMGDLSRLIPDTILNGLDHVTAPIIHPVLKDNFYVLSEAFYTDSLKGERSILEVCVMNYLEHHTINLRYLNALAATYRGWGILERFYYTPILILLIKSALKGD